MAVTGTWNVVITRLDKSKLRYSEQHGHGPRAGDVLETVVDGKLVKAEVDMFHQDMLQVVGFGVWTVEATKSSCFDQRTVASALSTAASAICPLLRSQDLLYTDLRIIE
jgi:hypothetical protein